MRVGSLCSGYGGLDEAVEEVFGGRMAWCSDTDPGARRVLEYRYPDVANLGDLTAVDWKETPAVDILTAGY